ncbi:(Fe-S)-binding protein [Laribacter hongkongensis]|uniref:(Fe-S)-binding protein n=1 Tax=Laribacter hongkongensis TaxID=168471 RepID=UPI001EFD1455|nr:(Fe-S)-binding protein [Laribacter hongkongensis]MCG9107085.1 (Fe-S)-binding protein [Laribacter hongkongensis]
MPAPAGRPSAVYLFGTCLLDLFLPEAGLDAVTLIEREGVAVHYPPEQSCCGQPAYSSGHPDEAREVARAQLALFPEPWPIVVPSGSCAGMMKHHWPQLFEGDRDAGRAAAVAARVIEFSDFLVNVLHWQRPDQGAPARVAVHTSCSARREMGTHLTSWQLVDQLAHVTRVVHDHEPECCGFGGVFSVKHPEISGAMADDKTAALLTSGATEFVTADAGCLMNLNGKLAHDHQRLPGKHLATFLLERSQGRP